MLFWLLALVAVTAAHLGPDGFWYEGADEGMRYIRRQNLRSLGADLDEECLAPDTDDEELPPPINTEEDVQRVLRDAEELKRIFEEEEDDDIRRWRMEVMEALFPPEPCQDVSEDITAFEKVLAFALLDEDMEMCDGKKCWRKRGRELFQVDQE